MLREIGMRTLEGNANAPLRPMSTKPAIPEELSGLVCRTDAGRVRKIS